MPNVRRPRDRVSSRRMRAQVIITLALLTGACGGSSQKKADGAEDGAEEGSAAAEEDIPVTPLKPAPPGLSASEQKELAALCNPIEPLMYDAGKQAVATLEAELAKGSADADKKALDAGLAMLKDNKGLGPDDQKRCLELFEKQQKLRIHEHEPAEGAARSAIKSCVERAAATFGKKSVDYDMGGTGEAAAEQGPFCPDDFPVPQSLKQLPYKSTSEDWNNNTWRCLSFGLRGEQAFQIEYSAPVGANEFNCIARYLPRQGGAPFELAQGGKVNAQGELLVAKKIVKRRMK